MANNSFLESIANYYIKGKTDLSRLCLVFPNKRAAIFMRMYLKRNIRKTTILPEITTIGAFYTHFVKEDASASPQVDRVHLLFILYKAYRKVLQARGFEPRPLDGFIFWGDMMLNDFDHIDSSLADPEKLYVNIERYNEISANYLTEEQKEVITEIWGSEAVSGIFNEEDKPENFWKHLSYVEGEDVTGSARFLRLWRVMKDIYDQFQVMLAETGLTYPGKLQRDVYHAIKTKGRDELGYLKIAFIGFGALTNAQVGMFRYLQKLDIADFFWDVADTKRLGAIQAGLQLKQLVGRFPMPEDYQLPVRTDKPNVEVIAVPSNFLMTKAIGKKIKEWDTQKILNTRVPYNTALILPDTSLLPAVLHGIPLEAGRVNITMGLSYKQTAFATLLRSIVSMHMRQRVIGGAMNFYHEDVSGLISSPQMNSLFPKACEAVGNFLQHNKLYNLDALTLTSIKGAEEIVPVFKTMNNPKDSDQVKQYISGVMAMMRKALERLSAEGHAVEGSGELEVLDSYDDAIQAVFHAIDKYGVENLGEGLILGLLEKILAVGKINTSGTPVAGMQILGMLETRALDFENIIVSSLNERVLPRRTRLRTLIPQIFRRAYGLPTMDQIEDEYAYYFFRLLNRASRVTLYYDSRSTGLAAGAISRYLLQLRHLSPGIMHEHSLHIETSSPITRTIEVKKTPEIMHILEGYKDDRRGMNISASALKKYKSCTLRFYLENVRGFHEDDNPEAFMDASTYGNVVHSILDHIYTSLRVNKEDNTTPTPVTSTALLAFIKQPDKLLTLAENTINEIYHHGSYTGRMDKLPGESRLLAEMMRDYVVKYLEKEVKDIAGGKTYDFIDAEHSLRSVGSPRQGQKWVKTARWQVTPQNAINIRMDIDRLDRLPANAELYPGGVYRFVDYKTGKDLPIVSKIQDLFSGSDNDAIFQLLFYAAAYSDLCNPGEDKQIQFGLIRFPQAFLKKISKKQREFEDEGIYLGTPTKNRKLVWTGGKGTDSGWEQEFLTRLGQLIDEIFDPAVSFKQTENTDNCKYCPFLDLCERQLADNDE